MSPNLWLVRGQRSILLTIRRTKRTKVIQKHPLLWRKCSKQVLFSVSFLIFWQASFIGSGYLVTPSRIEVGADKGETKRKRRSVDSSAAGVSESQGLIQSLKDEIESIKRPSGTQTNPARSCRDLHMCRGDLKDGMWLWLLYIVVFDKWTGSVASFQDFVLF